MTVPQRDSKKKADPSQGDDHAALLEQLKIAQQEAERMKDLAARAQADLQNGRARLEREAGDMRRYAAQDLLLKILPTLDNFRRAYQHLPEDLRSHEWIRGLEAVEQRLFQDLQAVGLKRMECMGKPVDPQRHEVLTAGPGVVDTVVEVFEDGYEFHDRVLRPAKVKVGNGNL